MAISAVGSKMPSVTHVVLRHHTSDFKRAIFLSAYHFRKLQIIVVMDASTGDGMAGSCEITTSWFIWERRFTGVQEWKGWLLEGDDGCLHWSSTKCSKDTKHCYIFNCKNDEELAIRKISHPHNNKCLVYGG